MEIITEESIGEEGRRDPVSKLQPGERESYKQVCKILRELGNGILPEGSVRTNEQRRGLLSNDQRSELIQKKAVEIVLLMRK